MMKIFLAAIAVLSGAAAFSMEELERLNSGLLPRYRMLQESNEEVDDQSDCTFNFENGFEMVALTVTV